MSQISFPYSLTEGTVAFAVQVMANFNVLKTLLNAGVGSDNVADLSITTAKLAELAVTAAKLGDGSVTTDKLADLGVTTAKIADLNISTGKIAGGAITNDKIANATITGDKLVLGTVNKQHMDGTFIENMTDAYQHTFAAAPHSGHETPAGAQTKVDAHVNDATDAHAATAISNSPLGNIAATTVQAALNELDSEKVAVSDVATSATANKILKLDASAKLPASVTGNADASDALLDTHKSSSDHDTHNDARFYTKTQLQTTGQSSVHWGNLTNVPNLADSSWKTAVATYSALPTTNNAIGDMRIVANDGDGKTAMYHCKATTGTIAEQWEKLADLDWTNDHGQLVGLGDDDHTQYHNDTRGDARYYTKTAMDTALGGKSDTTHNHGTDYVSQAAPSFGTDVAFNGHQALDFVCERVAAFPLDPVVGQEVVLTGDGHKYMYQGAIAGWVRVSGRGAVPKIKNFTASLTGTETFDLSSVGAYEVGTNSLLVFVNGALKSHNELTSTTFSVAVADGDSVHAWFLENSPEVVNVAVQKDGSLQANLNSDMVDTCHVDDAGTGTDTLLTASKILSLLANQTHTAGQIPEIDGLNKKTLTGSVASTDYYAFAQTDVDPTSYSGTFKITVSSQADANIKETMYLRVAGDRTIRPTFEALAEHYSLTAANTGIYNLRFVYQKTVGNGYRAYVELSCYSATQRDITVELIEADGLSMLPSLTVSAYNSTYHNVYTSAVPYNGLMLGSGTLYGNISGNSGSTYITYLDAYVAGESLTTADLIFLNTDNKWYKSAVAGRAIPLGAVLGRSNSVVSAGTGVSVYTQGRSTLQSGLSGTVNTYKDVYIRGQLAAGVFTADGYLTTELDAGYSYMRIGRAAASTICHFDQNNIVITVDSDGNSTINGLNLYADKLDGCHVNDAGSTTADLWTASKVATEIATKASFKKGSSTFTDNDTAQTFTDTFCTASSLVTIVVTSGTPAGAWTVTSADGSFTITSTQAESADIGFDYYIQK